MHIKSIAPIVTEQIIPSQLVSKNTEMTKTKEKLTLDRNLIENHLYNTSVLLPMIEQNAMIYVTEVEVNHEIILTTTIHKNRYRSISRDRFRYDKSTTPPHYLDHDMKTTRETRDVTPLLIDPHTDHLTDVTLVTDIDHAHIQEITTILHAIHLLFDHLRDPEILDFLELAHTPIKEINLIQINHKLKMTKLTLKYICITQLKWQTL